MQPEFKSTTFANNYYKNMIGQIFNAKEFSLKPKATIQQSGKLGFNRDAIDQLKISEEKGVVLAPDTSDKKVYYMAMVDIQGEHVFPVRVSGQYFYINTKQLFDKLEVDYANNSCIFDLVRCDKYDEQIGGECYKMTLRMSVRTQEDIVEE